MDTKTYLDLFKEHGYIYKGEDNQNLWSTRFVHPDTGWYIVIGNNGWSFTAGKVTMKGTTFSGLKNELEDQ